MSTSKRRAVGPKAMAGASALALSMYGCGKGKGDDADPEALLGGQPAAPYVAPEGEEATQYLDPASQAVPTDDAALGSLLAMAEAEDATPEGAALVADGGPVVAQIETAAVRLLRMSDHAKQSIDVTTFQNPDEATFSSEPLQQELNLLPPKVAPTHDPAKDVVKLDAKSWASKTELMISKVGAVSVKDQGQRGTCAAHTGIAHLEYRILKQLPKLKSIDLSEQRFYMMAKSDLWSKGGGKTNVDAGSAWIRGFQESWGFWGETSPSESTAYNIPLEVDCPYNKNGGSNEIQQPQNKKCLRGAVKVTKASTVYYWSDHGEPPSWYSDAVRSAQEIFDWLKTNDLPVPVAANITDGWMYNDGMITLAKSKNQKPVGGHAFLIVGARKLDEKKYPGEGGMCFVVKNSWGLGWGANGFSCMTLAWFNKFRQTGFFDVAYGVAVDSAYVDKMQAARVPANLVPGTPAAAKGPFETNPPKPVKVAKPKENLLSLTGDDAEADGAPADDEAPVATTTDDGFNAGFLVTPTGDMVRALYRIDGAAVTVRGVLLDEGGITQDLALGYDGNGQLLLDVPGRDPAVVGEIAGNTLILCAREYADVCSLNLVPTDGRLVVGLTQAAYESEAADPAGLYAPLASFASSSLEMAPVSETKADFRLVVDGQPTSGLRLALRPEDGAILAQGREVGNVQRLMLCSEDYAKVCRFVLDVSDRSLHLFFKSGK